MGNPIICTDCKPDSYVPKTAGNPFAALDDSGTEDESDSESTEVTAEPEEIGAQGEAHAPEALAKCRQAKPGTQEQQAVVEAKPENATAIAEEEV